MNVTERVKRDVLYAVARVDPYGEESYLTIDDASVIREQYVEAVAAALGVDLETALVWVDAARMSP